VGHPRPLIAFVQAAGDELLVSIGALVTSMQLIVAVPKAGLMKFSTIALTAEHQ
jgi:hypothetical protein